MVCCYISGFVCRFLILIWSKVGQILNVCGKCIEVWCVPSASCGLWVYKSQYSVPSIRVFFGLLFNILCYAPCGCSVYSSKPNSSVLSTAQTQQQCSVYSSNPSAVFASMIAFVFVKVERNCESFRLHVRIIFKIRERLGLLLIYLRTG